MAATWFTVQRGAGKHTARKHDASFDRYYTLRFSVAGRQVGRRSTTWIEAPWRIAG
jgi:hypothetical protein